MQITISTGELVLMQKLIEYVKFVAVDEDSSMLASNPFMNSLSGKVSGKLAKLGVGNKHAPQRLYLRDHGEITKVVVKKLSGHTDWDCMEIEDQRALVLNMIYPYLAAESEIDKIIDLVQEEQVTKQA